MAAPIPPPETLPALDSWWGSLRRQRLDPPPVVVQRASTLLGRGGEDADVVIAGGTLGIFLGAALAQRGWRVILLERGVVRGRAQEWNTSRRELQVLLELELLTSSEWDQVLASHSTAGRLGFGQGSPWWVTGVLEVGADPVALLEGLKQRFLAWGGQVQENTAFLGAVVHPDGIRIQTDKGSLQARLLVDAMGHRSPIVAQARQGQRPDSVCLVVGSCAQGLPPQETADLFYSFTPTRSGYQPFWEAFPARDGRTTYLFTYCDLQPERPSLATLWQDYCQLLPSYQGVELDQVRWVRKLCGVFPAYRQSPLALPWDRLLAVGDSSGCQSPLSFGGFGAMLRHLPRWQQGIHLALQTQQLDRGSLALLQPYLPNLSVTWLFQKAMIPRSKADWDGSEKINRLLQKVFAALLAAGPQAAKSFLQDVVQFGGLAQTLGGVMLRDPWLVLQLVPQFAPLELLEWAGHFAALGTYSLLDRGAGLVGDWARKDLAWQARLQAWRYGSGRDFAES